MSQTTHPDWGFTDKALRQWILNDPGLYAEARAFGHGNDEDMYRRLPEFIAANRSRLEAHIRRLQEQTCPS